MIIWSKFILQMCKLRPEASGLPRTVKWPVTQPSWVAASQLLNAVLRFVCVPEQSLFKAIQWKALYTIINELFFPLPFLFYINPYSKIVVLGSDGPYA